MKSSRVAKHIVQAGDHFGKWTALYPVAPTCYGNCMWMCRCECGKEQSVSSSYLVRGRTKSCITCSRCKEPNVFSFPLSYFNKIKQAAEKRSMRFDITPSYLQKLLDQQEGKCALSGLPLIFGRVHMDPQTGPVDRINSKKGYIRGNIQWVHCDVNLMKNAFDQSYFTWMCQQISANTEGT